MKTAFLLRKMASSVAKPQRSMDSTEEMECIDMLVQYQHGFLISKVMFTACELGVFDLLLESGVPLSSTTIAGRLGISPSGMELLLGACVGLKLLRTERKDEQDVLFSAVDNIFNGEAARAVALTFLDAVQLHRCPPQLRTKHLKGKVFPVENVFYTNTELSNLYLGKSSPKSQYNLAMWFSETTYLYLNHLADAVREGKNQLKKIVGSSNVYKDVYRSEERVRNFMSFMNSTWSLWGRAVIAAFDLSQFPHICDLGGSGGALAKECISLYPNCTVTIFDLPEVVRTSKEYFVSEEERRICFHEGDFFEDPIPEADLYVFSRIIHNWDGKKCVQLLSKIYKACRPGGGVLVIDMVLSEDRSGPLMTYLYSVAMLLHTEGKERTVSEISLLLTTAGFMGVENKKPKGPYGVLLARK